MSQKLSVIRLAMWVLRTVKESWCSILSAFWLLASGGVRIWVATTVLAGLLAGLLALLLAFPILLKMVVTLVWPTKMQGALLNRSLWVKAAFVSFLKGRFLKWVTLGVALKAANYLGIALQKENWALEEILERRSFLSRALFFMRHLLFHWFHETPNEMSLGKQVLLNMVHTVTLHRQWWHHLCLKDQLYSLDLLPPGGYIYVLGPPLLPLVFMGMYAAATHGMKLLAQKARVVLVSHGGRAKEVGGYGFGDDNEDVDDFDDDARNVDNDARDVGNCFKDVGVDARDVANSEDARDVSEDARDVSDDTRDVDDDARDVDDDARDVDDDARDIDDDARDMGDYAKDISSGVAGKIRATLMAEPSGCPDCKKCRHPGLPVIYPPELSEWNCAPLLYITGAGIFGCLPYPFGCLGCLCLGLGAYQDCKAMAVTLAREDYFNDRCRVCGHPHTWYDNM